MVFLMKPSWASDMNVLGRSEPMSATKMPSTEPSSFET